MKRWKINNKIWSGFFIFFILSLAITKVVFAIPAMQQRCEPSTTCIIGEYIFDDDGHTPMTTDNYCKITITNPSDTVIVNAENMPDKNDGWYYYSTSTLSSPEGLYRSKICCDVVGTEELCIDKSFILGTSFETVSAINYDVDLIRGATFDFAGFADTGSSSSTLVDAELNQPNDYWNNYRLIMMSGANFGEEKTVSDFVASSDSLIVSSPFSNTIASGDKYVLQHETRLVYQIWNYTTRTLTSFGTLVADVWSNSTRTLTAFGSLAADVWNGTFSPTRRLTDETLTGGGKIATQTDITNATTTLIAEINENQALIAALNNISAADVWLAATRTLTDYATSSIASASANEVWNKATSTLTGIGSIGKLLVDNINTTISSRGTSNLTAADVWLAATRTLTDYVTSSIATSVWSNATRTLTNYGNDITAQNVWDVLSSSLTAVGSIGKQLADNVDTTISSRATDAGVWANVTRTLTDYATSSIAAAVWGNTARTLTSFGTLVADIWNNTTRTLTDYASSTIASAVWNNATRNLTSFGTLVADIWSNTTRSLSTSTLDSGSLATLTDLNTLESNLRGASSTDLTTLAGYVDSVEGYIGIPTDTATTTLFGSIRDVRTKLNQLDTLETKIDTVDSVVDLIRASQLLGYKLQLSDAGEILETKNYRAKLTILDYQSNPVDVSSTPSIILYDALRATATSTTMTNLSTGVYEFVYTVASGAANGTWETLVSVDLGGSANVKLNDYWEVEGSPAQVVINSISDTTVPSISANTTISNEGSVGYEYQYEYCVVSTENNQCGGGDDTAYATAAKYLNAGQDWTTDLGLTVSNTGNYWFKVVVYWGTETSGASRTFTATEAPAPTPALGGGGGITVGVSLNTIYDKLVDVQNDLGYRGKPGIPQENIAATVYETLKIMSERLETIAGSEGCGLCNIFRLEKEQASNIDYLKNKLLELRALLDANKLLIDKAANQPVIKTWFEWGSVILKMLVINPSSSQTQAVPFRAFLPRETKPEYIIDREDLALDFDEENNLWYVHKEIKLGPGESATKRVEIKDVWLIQEEEISSLRSQFEDLLKPLEGTAFYAQAITLKSDSDRLLDGVARKQNEYKATPQEHIVAYRENMESLKAVQSNLDALKKLVAEESGASRALGSLFGVSTTMTWAIVIIVVVGIVILMVMLYTMLLRNQDLEYHLAGETGLQRHPRRGLRHLLIRQTSKLQSRFSEFTVKKIILVSIIIGILSLAGGVLVRFIESF